jgi:hypothetical protein
MLSQPRSTSMQSYSFIVEVRLARSGLSPLPAVHIRAGVSDYYKTRLYLLVWTGSPRSPKILCLSRRPNLFSCNINEVLLHTKFLAAFIQKRSTFPGVKTHLFFGDGRSTKTYVRNPPRISPGSHTPPFHLYSPPPATLSNPLLVPLLLLQLSSH